MGCRVRGVVRASSRSALELPAAQKGNNLRGFKGFYLEAIAKIWPWLSNMFRIDSIAD